MLIPIRHEKFEQLLPRIATGEQYAFFWGKFPDFLRRILISLVGIVVVLLLGAILGEAGQALVFILGIIAGLYWLWGPIYWASMKNASYRRIPYSGFWRGRVLDVFVTEELIGEEQTVNNRGELVVIENRERRINIEVGDRSGFRTELQAPLRRTHKVIGRGELVELLVLSYQPDLSRIAKVTDAYFPQHNLWIGEYPYLRRDFFAQVSRQLTDTDDDNYGSNSPPNNISRQRRRV